MDDPKRVADDEICVEPPSQIAVKTLGAIDVRNRDYDDVALHIDHPSGRGPRCLFTAHRCAAHDGLRGLVVK